MKISGNYTALITPFKKNLNIDYSSLKELCELQIQNQTNGIVALGSTAEASSLDVYEKHKVMETLVSTSNGQIPIIAGVNAFTLCDALYQSNARFLDGANALLVSPPPYIKPSQQQLIAYFNEIADKSYIPIILYNIPSRTNINISEEVVYKLASHPNIIGIKEASGNIAYAQKLSNITKDLDFTLIAGNDDILLPMLTLNTKAIISVIGNIIPNLCKDVIDLFHNGHINDCISLYNKYLPLIDGLSCETNPVSVKYVLSVLGLCNPYLRHPLDLPAKKNKRLLNNLIDVYLLN